MFQKGVFLKNMRSLLYLLLGTGCLFISCKPKESTTENDASTTDAVVTSDLYNDSLVLSRKTIVFYQLRDDQVDSILAEEPEGGIADVASDFIYYSGLATDSLRRASYDVIYTNKRFISCMLADSTRTVIDRNQQGLKFGMIITDAKNKPGIVDGVKTDIEYLNEAGKITATFR